MDGFRFDPNVEGHSGMTPIPAQCPSPESNPTEPSNSRPLPLPPRQSVFPPFVIPAEAGIQRTKALLSAGRCQTLRGRGSSEVTPMPHVYHRGEPLRLDSGFRRNDEGEAGLTRRSVDMTKRNARRVRRFGRRGEKIFAPNERGNPARRMKREIKGAHSRTSGGEIPFERGRSSGQGLRQRERSDVFRLAIAGRSTLGRRCPAAFPEKSLRLWTRKSLKNHGNTVKYQLPTNMLTTIWLTKENFEIIVRQIC